MARSAAVAHLRRALHVQLNGNSTVKDFEEVVKLDCEYIDNWSLWLDFKIVAKTVTKVMRGEAW